MPSINSADPVFSASVAAVVSRILAAGSNVTLTPVNGQIQIAASGGGSSVAAPGLVPDLTLWFASDNILGTAGRFITRLQERTPWIGGVLATPATTSVVACASVDSNTLNSLPLLKSFTASTNAYNLLNPFQLPVGATFFAVIKPNTAVTGALQAIIGGAGSSLALYLNSGASVASCGLVKTGAAVIGASTATWSSGTAFQMNATYIVGTGAYAFRQARAAAGSGTGAANAGTGNTSFLFSDAALGTNFLNAHSVAELIVYNRVLTNTEITTIETYLNTKWGV